MLRIRQIPFEWLEFGVECFESRSNSSNLHLNSWNLHSIALNLFCKFAFEYFEFHLQGSNLPWNALNPFRMVRICIRILRGLFEWFQFGFEWFESLFNG